MLTSLPLLLVWTGKGGEHEWSPTGISSFLECQRKWAWRKIAKIETASGAGADLGGRSHKIWERYLATGERPNFVADKEAAAVASLTLHLLPEPKTPGMFLEQHFRFKSARTGFVYHGFKDVSLRPGVPVAPLGFDGSAPIVLDHKTSKNIAEYAKTKDDLQDNDPQSILYGLDAMARYASDVADLGWVYAQTKGAKRAQPTTTRLHAKHALKIFDVIEDVAAEASSVLDRGLQPLDLPPNVSACRAFGGCPYLHLCNLSPSQKARSRMSNSVIANLRARVQGTASPVPTPSIMGCSDKDVPAPTEIPAVFLSEPPSATVAINPPESALPPPAMTQAASAEEPKEKRKRRTKAEMAADAAAKDPLGADAHAHTGSATPLEPADQALADDASKDSTPGTPDPALDAKAQSVADAAVAKCETPIVVRPGTVIGQHVDTKETQGFTLYVDCIPIGKPAKAAARLIEKAQDRIHKELGVADYRLIDFGKGVPPFIAFVDEQVDGTFDLALDTRTPEGAVLLETLMAKAAFVVRGLR